MIKNIVLDMGNVCLKWNPQAIVSNYTDDEVLQNILVDRIFNSEYWLMGDAGSIDMETLKLEIHAHLYASMHEIADKILDTWYLHMPVIETTLQLVKELKDKGFNLYLLSNANVQFDEYKDQKEIFKYFDGFFISAKEQMVKPALMTYYAFLDKFNLKSEECVFVDDVIDNVEGAIRAGIKAYQFTGDADGLKNWLDSQINSK